MTTSYPGGLDNFTNPTSGDSLNTSGVLHSTQHANLNDAVEAIEGELGVDPSGAAATVAARFTAVESAASTLSTTVAGKAAKDVRVFDAVAYGAAVNGSTNDTAAWQAAIDACAAAGGGVVTSSKNGVSVISGALQDTSGANAQILLPSVHATSSEQISITIAGLTQPPTVASVVGAQPTPDNHLVLKSTLASGAGAVIGCKGPTGSFQNFSNLHAAIQNVTIRTVANPTISGLDLSRVAAVDLDAVIVDTGSYDVDALTQPSTSTSVGIKMPARYNGAHSRMGQVDVIGFYTGVTVAEHVNGYQVNAWGCRVAVEVAASDHASVFWRLMATHCTVGIKFTGAHALDVWQFDIEHANTSQGWRQTSYDIDDPSNLGAGNVRWWSVLAGTGSHNVFTKNGGSGVTTSRVGAALGTGGGGTSDYTYRDRLIAAAGNTVLTLGATPVANSPLVWVNGAIKWPGTDYTISGSAITFGTALAASDVVAVQYRSTSSTASASTLTTPGPTVIAADTFTRSDSASSMGTTTTGSKAWSALFGTWGIASNTAYVSTGGGSNFAVVDAGLADVTVSAVITTTGGVQPCGLALRATSATALYVAEVQAGGSGTPQIYKIVGGTTTSIATGASVTFNQGDTLSAVLSGNTITVKRNGTTIVSVTDSTHPTATKHGFYNYAPGGAGGARFDDFSITA